LTGYGTFVVSHWPLNASTLRNLTHAQPAMVFALSRPTSSQLAGDVMLYLMRFPKPAEVLALNWMNCKRELAQNKTWSTKI